MAEPGKANVNALASSPPGLQPSRTPFREERSTRALATRMVARWLQGRTFPDQLLGETSDHHGFLQEVVFGVIRRLRTLDWMLGRCAARSPDRKLRAVLLVAAYQILFMDNEPAYAVVNDAVEAVKSAWGHARGFVNAVLRRLVRERDALLDLLRRERLGVRESHPDLLVERWTAQYGAARAEALCRWNNTRPDVCVRPNALKVRPSDLQAAWQAAGLDVRPHPRTDSGCLILPRGIRVEAIPGYEEGFFTVQDPSTTVAVVLLDPQPGERILDACAAPGGKTALMAERLQGSGEIWALERRADRIVRLRENVRRLGLRNVRIAEADAVDPEAIRRVCGPERFDRVLLDVPCTNTGVLRRRPDARWRFSLQRLRACHKIQEALLDAAVAVLRPKGRLVYSTCSLEPEENHLLVGAWCERRSESKAEGEVFLFPPEAGCDGAYAVALRVGATGPRSGHSSPFAREGSGPMGRPAGEIRKRRTVARDGGGS